MIGEGAVVVAECCCASHHLFDGASAVGPVGVCVEIAAQRLAQWAVADGLRLPPQFLEILGDAVVRLGDDHCRLGPDAGESLPTVGLPARLLLLVGQSSKDLRSSAIGLDAVRFSA